MDSTWVALLVVWGVVETIQAIRKRPFPQRMKTGAIWGVSIAVLAALGSASREINSFSFIAAASAIYGTPALLAYWVRLYVAKTVKRNSNEQPLELAEAARISTNNTFNSIEMPQPLNNVDGMTENAVTPTAFNGGLARRNKNPSEKSWSAALAEFESTTRRHGVWAKAFAESAGNEAVAKAEYLRMRAHEIHAESLAAEDVERQRQQQQAEGHRQEEERQRAATAYANLMHGECNDLQITAACEAYLSALGFKVERPKPNKWQISSPGTGTTYAYSVEDLRKKTADFVLWIGATSTCSGPDGAA